MDSFRGKHPFWVSAAKDSFRLTGPIASAKKSPDMENTELKTYDLARFPDYSFDVTGQPYRKTAIKRGPKSGTLVVTRFTTTAGEEAFKLYDQNGRRTSVLRRSLARALDDQELIPSLEPLSGFVTYFVDLSGQPYCLKPSGILHKLNLDTSAQTERFVLYDRKGRRRTLTRAALIRLANQFPGHKSI